jgi:hypothetical protein
VINWAKLGQFPSLHLQDPADEERDTGCGPRPVRALLAQAAVEVAALAVDKGAVREGAPAVVRFLGQITTRFGIGPVKFRRSTPLIAIITIPKLPNSNCRAPGQTAAGRRRCR